MTDATHSKTMDRIYLSPPHMGAKEREMLLDAFDSNWIAPLGPHVNGFEAELAAYLGTKSSAALSSGTGGLHLALDLLNVGRGDRVYVSTLTFAASVNVIRYQGAVPVFIDADRTTWNLDPNLVAEQLRLDAARNMLPKAIIAVDLYGQCADYDALRTESNRYDIPIIEDAAESLGATYKGRNAGTLGDIGVFSFNGNKILTTSGGGALVAQNDSMVDRARFLASQAKEPAAHYEHRCIGYNYRLSNLLAAVGRAQLATLDAKVATRRGHFDAYLKSLSRRESVRFMPEAEYGRSNRWLTCLTLATNSQRDHLLSHLAEANVEARPVWKPMHAQPVFAEFESVGGAVADSLFGHGLCLPSGSAMTPQQRDRVIERILSCEVVE